MRTPVSLYPGTEGGPKLTGFVELSFSTTSFLVLVLAFFRPALAAAVLFLLRSIRKLRPSHTPSSVTCHPASPPTWPWDRLLQQGRLSQPKQNQVLTHAIPTMLRINRNYMHKNETIGP